MMAEMPGQMARAHIFIFSNFRLNLTAVILRRIDTARLLVCLERRSLPCVLTWCLLRRCHLIARSVGLAPTKAKHLIALSQQILDRYDGKVPQTFEGLQSLPGVGTWWFVPGFGIRCPRKCCSEYQVFG